MLGRVLVLVRQSLVFRRCNPSFKLEGCLTNCLSYLHLLLVEAILVGAKCIIVLATAHANTLLVTKNIVGLVRVDVVAFYNGLHMNSLLETMRCVYTTHR